MGKIIAERGLEVLEIKVRVERFENHGGSGW